MHSAAEDIGVNPPPRLRNRLQDAFGDVHVNLSEMKENVVGNIDVGGGGTTLRGYSGGCVDNTAVVVW
jgi:hypothetical protein